MRETPRWVWCVSAIVLFTLGVGASIFLPMGREHRAIVALSRPSDASVTLHFGSSSASRLEKLCQPVFNLLGWTTLSVPLSIEMRETFPPEQARLLRHVRKVRSVKVNSRFGDDDLRCLDGKRSLDELVLDGSRVTDKGLQVLRSLNLEHLSLIGTQAGDDTLRCLRTMTRLKTLRLDQTRITDAGLACLANLPPLKTLTLSHTAITDAGLEHLKSGCVLDQLILSHTRITTAGLIAIDNEPGLIDVSETNVRWTPALKDWLEKRTRLRVFVARGCGFGESELTASDGPVNLFQWQPKTESFSRK